MHFRAEYGRECDLNGESWPHDSKQCEEGMCIACSDGKWIEQDDVFV
jgi:hypothetical protein